MLVDSMRTDAENNVSKKIESLLFGDNESKTVFYSSVFSSRTQFDSNSCGAWLVAGFGSFIFDLPEVLHRDDAFAVCYNILGMEKVDVTPSDTNSSLETEFSNFDNLLNQFSDAEFLIKTLSIEPKKSVYYRSSPPKGIRTNYFYVTDVANSSSSVRDDDNGAYKNTRSTKKHYVCENGKFYIARKEDGKFYYSERIQSNKYIKHFREDEHIIELKRSYEVAKSFPLQRIITTFSKLGNPPSPYTAVLYKIISPISDDTKVEPHGNATKSDRPYYKTSRSVLSRVKSELEKGKKPQKVYDQINKESGGVFSSLSQSNELRDCRQIYRQTQSIKKEKKKNSI